MLLFSGQTTARASASWAVVWLGFASAFSAPVTLALRLAGRHCVRLVCAVAAPLSAPATHFASLGAAGAAASLEGSLCRCFTLLWFARVGAQRHRAFRAACF